MRAERERQKQVEAGMQMAQMGADTAHKLSQTQMVGDNALVRGLEAAGVGL